MALCTGRQQRVKNGNNRHHLGLNRGAEKKEKSFCNHNAKGMVQKQKNASHWHIS